MKTEHLEILVEEPFMGFIAAHIEPERNNSKSFQILRTALLEMVTL